MRFTLILVLVSAGVPTMAAAQLCRPDCVPEVLLPNSGRIPVNLPELTWVPDAPLDLELDEASLAEATLVTLEGTEVPIRVERRAPHRYAVIPEEPLEEGQSYIFEAPGFCSGLSSTHELAVDGPIALPERGEPLGSSSSGGGGFNNLMVAGSEFGECSTDVFANSVLVLLELTERLEPWREMLVFTTLVDGEVWRPSASVGELPPYGGSWRGRGLDEVFNNCFPVPGVSAGAGDGFHTVEFSARIPGTDVVLYSTPLDVDLSCPAEEMPPMDFGRPFPPGFVDGAGDDITCSCTTPGRGRFPSGVAFLALVVLFGRIRRRLG